MTPNKPIRDPFAYLRTLPNPRPFAWYGFIRQRRILYGFTATGLLVLLVVLPLMYSLMQMHSQINFDRIKPNQILLFFGMLVVVAFVRYTYVLESLWKDSRWLARFGRIEEANMLWVIRNPQRIVATYRFWTQDGLEIVRETVIDADGPHALAEMKAGDIVPVLYDPKMPKRRNLLWAEIERYVALPRAYMPAAQVGAVRETA